MRAIFIFYKYLRYILEVRNVSYHLMKAGLPKECEDEMGFTHPTHTSWILIEGYDHIWKIEQSSNHRVDCGGVTRIKY